jgi:hypothetical protein
MHDGKTTVPLSRIYRNRLATLSLALGDVTMQ